MSAIVAYAVIPIYVESQKRTARLSASSLRRLVGTWRLTHPGEDCPDVARLRTDKLIDSESSSSDPWGSPYAIKCPEDDVVVMSSGPDKRAGTGDDIVVPGGIGPQLFEGGTTYYILASHYPVASGGGPAITQYQIRIDGPSVPPQNDLCGGAEVLPGAGPFPRLSSTVSELQKRQG